MAWVQTVIQWGLILYLIIAPTVVVIWLKKSAATAFALIVAGATALVFTRLPDISSLKLLGLQATLERQIGQVQVTIEELQRMATAMADANLTELAMSGQLLHGIKTEVKFTIHDQIVNSMKEIGVPNDKILESQRTWINVYCDILLSHIAGEANTLFPGANDEINKLPEYPDYGLPDPDTLQKWISSHSLSSPKLDQLLDEYKRLWTTGTMKDPSIIPFNSVMRMRP